MLSTLETVRRDSRVPPCQFKGEFTQQYLVFLDGHFHAIDHFFVQLLERYSITSANCNYHFQDSIKAMYTHLREVE